MSTQEGSILINELGRQKISAAQANLASACQDRTIYVHAMQLMLVDFWTSVCHAVSILLLVRIGLGKPRTQQAYPLEDASVDVARTAGHAA